MWIFTDQQLKDITTSLRERFERRAFATIHKLKLKEMNDDDTIHFFVHKQTKHIDQFELSDKNAFAFIELSLYHKKLQEDKLIEDIEDILQNSSPNDLINNLKTFLMH